jgi:hypothetical protein
VATDVSFYKITNESVAAVRAVEELVAVARNATVLVTNPYIVKSVLCEPLQRNPTTVLVVNLDPIFPSKRCEWGKTSASGPQAL